MSHLKTLLVAVSACCALPGHAVIVFSDNFENDTPNTSLTTASPDVGTYQVPPTTGQAVVAGSAGYPAASPTGGSQFLRADASAALSPNFIGARNNGFLTSPVGGAGTTFHFQVQLYVTASTGLGFGFGNNLTDSGGNRTESGTTSGTGGNVTGISFQTRMAGTSLQVLTVVPSGVSAGTRNYVTVGTFAQNQWYQYEVDYVFGSGTVNLKATNLATSAVQNIVLNGPNAFVPFVNGSVVTPVNNITQVDSVSFFTVSSNAVGYFDNVEATGTLIPEPASLALVSLGAFTLLAGRRRA